MKYNEIHKKDKTSRNKILSTYERIKNRTAKYGKTVKNATKKDCRWIFMLK